MVCTPHQIGQAIEEVNSNNQELLRKYRRELQLRKKCHNELVRLKGDCRRAGGGHQPWGLDLAWQSCLELTPPLRHYSNPISVDKETEAQRRQGACSKPHGY